MRFFKNFHARTKNFSLGLSLVEVMVVVAIGVLVMVFFGNIFTLLFRAQEQKTVKLGAESVVDFVKSRLVRSGVVDCDTTFDHPDNAGRCDLANVGTNPWMNVYSWNEAESTAVKLIDLPTGGNMPQSIMASVSKYYGVAAQCVYDNYTGRLDLRVLLRPQANNTVGGTALRNQLNTTGNKEFGNFLVGGVNFINLGARALLCTGVPSGGSPSDSGGGSGPGGPGGPTSGGTSSPSDEGGGPGSVTSGPPVSEITPSDSGGFPPESPIGTTTSSLPPISPPPVSPTGTTTGSPTGTTTGGPGSMAFWWDDQIATGGGGRNGCQQQTTLQIGGQLMAVCPNGPCTGIAYLLGAMTLGPAYGMPVTFCKQDAVTCPAGLIDRSADLPPPPDAMGLLGKFGFAKTKFGLDGNAPAICCPPNMGQHEVFPDWNPDGQSTTCKCEDNNDGKKGKVKTREGNIGDPPIYFCEYSIGESLPPPPPPEPVKIPICAIIEGNAGPVFQTGGVTAGVVIKYGYTPAECLGLCVLNSLSVINNGDGSQKCVLVPEPTPTPTPTFDNCMNACTSGQQCNYYSGVGWKCVTTGLCVSDSECAPGYHCPSSPFAGPCMPNMSTPYPTGTPYTSP